MTRRRVRRTNWWETWPETLRMTWAEILQETFPAISGVPWRVTWTSWRHTDWRWTRNSSVVAAMTPFLTAACSTMGRWRPPRWLRRRRHRCKLALLENRRCRGGRGRGRGRGGRGRGRGRGGRAALEATVADSWSLQGLRGGASSRKTTGPAAAAAANKNTKLSCKKATPTKKTTGCSRTRWDACGRPRTTTRRRGT